MRDRLRHTPPRVLVVLLLGATLAAAGCTSDTTVPASGPLTLREAMMVAEPHVAQRAQAIHLVGFVGHEGAPPTALSGLLADLVSKIDTTSLDERRGDGRAHVWVLLYGTSEGRLLRVVVRDAPRDVSAEWSDAASSELVQQLWAMNLGGRLRFDSSYAATALAQADDAIRAHLEAHPDAQVAYASTIAPTEGAGTEDLVYEFFYGTRGAARYALYGQVYHFTGDVVMTGDAEDARLEREVTLVEHSFTLGPVPNEVFVTEESPRRVEAARMFTTAQGTGTYELSILRDNETLIGSTEGRVLTDTQEDEVPLGVLAPGAYTLHVKVTGRVTFDLRIDGTIGL